MYEVCYKAVNWGTVVADLDMFWLPWQMGMCTQSSIAFILLFSSSFQVVVTQ